MNSIAVGFALGSNLGARASYISQAQRALRESFALQEVKASALYETPALMPEGADASYDKPYLNQVIVAHMPMPEPLEVLARIKQIESETGRQARGHWAPREIDIDLLFLDDLILNTPTLTLPHALMHTRAFVMAPLAEISPGWKHPLLGGTAQDIAAMLSTEGMTRHD